jgi:hypothetical protein
MVAGRRAKGLYRRHNARYRRSVGSAKDDYAVRRRAGAGMEPTAQPELSLSKRSAPPALSELNLVEIGLRI